MFMTYSHQTGSYGYSCQLTRSLSSLQWMTLFIAVGSSINQICLLSRDIEVAHSLFQWTTCLRMQVVFILKAASSTLTKENRKITSSLPDKQNKQYGPTMLTLSRNENSIVTVEGDTMNESEVIKINNDFSNLFFLWFISSTIRFTSPSPQNKNQLN